MAKSYFTPTKMLEHFEPHVGDVLDYTQEELAEEISEYFWVEFPSAHGFPTCFPGQPDYTEIARILQQERAEALLRDVDADALVLLGEEWLDKMAEAASTEDPATAIACDKRLEEIEAEINPNYLHGLHVALDWALAREQEVLDAAV